MRRGDAETRRRGVAALLWLATVPCALAHDVISTKLTWSQEISRIVYRHCASCHREGGGSFALMTYDDARPWAKAIRDEVVSRRMPPWGPVKGVGEFRDDPSLSQIEIDMIVNWVEGGAPKGDDIYLPASPHFGAEAKVAAAREVKLTSSTPIVLDDGVIAAGISPRSIGTGASLEVTAYRPDGAVEHLIWIRQWRVEDERTYYFRNSIRLPKGTRVAVYSSEPAEASLVLSATHVRGR